MLLPSKLSEQNYLLSLNLSETNNWMKYWLFFSNAFTVAMFDVSWTEILSQLFVRMREDRLRFILIILNSDLAFTVDNKNFCKFFPTNFLHASPRWTKQREMGLMIKFLENGEIVAEIKHSCVSSAWSDFNLSTTSPLFSFTSSESFSQS